MRALIAAALLALAGQAWADDITDFSSWVTSQSVSLGTSMGIKSSARYVATGWDMVSFGQKGVNVFSAGALDYIDLGPAWTAANGEKPRFGQAIPIHFGNLWNFWTGHLPVSIGEHVHTTHLPGIILSPLFLWPTEGRVTAWRWDRDFQVALSCRFGGSN